MAETKLRPSGYELIKTMSSPHKHPIDGIFMALFIFRIPAPGIPAILPLGDVAAILLVVIAVFRPVTQKHPISKIYMIYATGIVLFSMLISLINEVDPVRRLLKVIELFALAGTIAARKIDLIAGLRGLAIALFVNIPLFFSGLTSDNYGGKLTGVLADKNVAGLFYAVIPLLVLMITKNVALRLLIIISAAGALYLTGSRSSLAAFGFALLWLAIAPRLRTFGKLVLGAILLPIYFWVNDNFAQFGEYADRVGSDALRARIDAASLAKTIQAPWYGLGLGQSQVNIDGKLWFFHNSYWALIAEGGYPLLIAIVGLYAVIGLRLFQPKILNPVSVYIETATVAIYLCAIRLGEVFFTIPGFLVIGVGLSLAIAFTTNQLAERSTELVQHAPK